MKILFDYQIFGSQKFGGISRVFFEIIKQSIIDKNLFEGKISILLNKNEYIKSLSIDKLYNVNEKVNFKGKRRIIEYINKKYCIKQIKKNEFDIFHPTYYDPYFLDYLSKPFVLTVHDMIHELYIKEDIKTINNKKLLIDRADKIIAISENTKKDIMEIYNVDSSKIEVIHWANSLNEIEKIDTPKKYILFVGVRHNYKNFNTFITAAAKILNKDNELSVICVGGGKFTSEEYKLLTSLGILKNVIQMSVNDEQLGYLYKNAEVFVYPSLYEGFGIPILEAFNFNCPVALSNTSCFPEIAGECAEYFDPNNIDDIQRAIEKIIYDKEYREYLIDKGMKRNKEFSWEKTGKRYNDIYRSLLKNEN